MAALGDGSGSAAESLRRMYVLLDVMCRAGVRPDARTAEIMASAALEGGGAGAAEAAKAVLEEFRVNGVAVDAAAWDARLAAASAGAGDAGAAGAGEDDADDGADGDGEREG